MANLNAVRAGRGESIGGGKLDIQPFLIAVGVAPDTTHFFASIAWNQPALRSDPETIIPQVARAAGTGAAGKYLGSGRLAAGARA